MDIPSLFMIPSAVSSGKVHSVFPNSTDADFDFNRDSDATRVNSEGLIERVGFYGSELVTNGGFDTDSNWSKDGWKIENGKAINTLASAGLNLYQGSVTSVGNTFKVVLDSVISAGGLKVLLGGGSGGYNEIGQTSSTGTHTFVGVSNGTDNRILIQTLSGSTIGSVIVDNVSVKQVNGDKARLNYEIEGGLVNTKPSLLLEPQSTNLITYSEDLTNGWLQSSVDITSNVIIAPDGTMTADLITPQTNNNFHYVRSNNGGDLSASGYNMSFFAKANGYNFVRVFNNIIGVGVDIDIVNEVVSNKSVEIGDVSVKNYGEWKKIEVQYIGSRTFSYLAIQPMPTGGLTTFSGNGFSGVYVWGAQIEALSYPTSYIPTNGSTQTRAAETCTGAGTSSIFESTEGILYFEVAFNNAAANNISLSDGSGGNRVNFAASLTANRFKGVVRVGGTTVFNVHAQAIDNTQNFNKYAIKWKENDFALWCNGTERNTDTSGSSFSAGTLTTLSFNRGDALNDFHGKIRDIRVYNTKEMTDSEVDILLTKITS